MKISINKNLKVYMEENSSCVELAILLIYFPLSNAVSGIDSRTMNINTIMVIVPQKNEINMASFLLTS